MPRLTALEPCHLSSPKSAKDGAPGQSYLRPSKDAHPTLYTIDICSLHARRIVRRHRTDWPRIVDLLVGEPRQPARPNRGKAERCSEGRSPVTRARLQGISPALRSGLYYKQESATPNSPSKLRGRKSCSV